MSGGASTEANAQVGLGEICLEAPFYRVLARGDGLDDFARRLQDETISIDAYCVNCQREAPFKRLKFKLEKAPPTIASARYVVPEPVSLFQTVSLICGRCGNHYYFYFAPYGGGIAKVGQTPSQADIAAHDMAQFKSELDSLDMLELQHATRLYGFRIGVAAYVYLRRIFERLLVRHYEAYEQKNGPIEDYDRMAVDERVLALRSVLPAEVVENRRVYSILSLAIHELSEEDCLAYYPVVRAAIVEILERDLAERRRAQASSNVRNAVADLAGKLGKRAG